MAEEVFASCCSICLTKYKLPKQLECFHIFCTPCLEKLIAGKPEISCPLCKHLIIINENGIDMFKSYEYQGFQNGEEDAKEIRTCQMCDDNEVYSECTDCSDLMCRNCHEYHLKHKTFRTHSVKRLEITEIKMADTEVQSCTKHNKDCDLYCRSCNDILCECCAKEDHKTHETESVKSIADILKHSLSATVGGLKSKLPYIKTFIECSKAEEEKYQKHVDETCGEIKLAASNLKDVFCNSVDMICEQNIEYLKRQANKDKKKIQNLIDETEREELSIQHLVKISEDAIKYSHVSEMAKSGDYLNRKVSSCENVNFPSLIVNVLKYRPGNFRDELVKECMGTIQRQSENRLHFQLSVPRFEVPSYIINNFVWRETKDLNIDFTAMFADSEDQIYLFKLADSQHGQQARYFYAECINCDGNIMWKKQLKVPGHFSMVAGMKSNKVFLWFPSKTYFKGFIWINDVNHFKEGTVEERKIKVELQHLMGECACIANNGNILIWNTYKKELYEVEETTRKVRTLPISDKLTWKDTSGIRILCSLFNHILVLSTNEIRCYGSSGDLKHRFCPENPVEFTSMCMGRHGNVFVADASENRICLLTWDGHYVKDVLLSSDGINKPKSLIVDAVGNLWVLTNDKKLSFYSYL